VCVCHCTWLVKRVVCVCVSLYMVGLESGVCVCVSLYIVSLECVCVCVTVHG